MGEQSASEASVSAPSPNTLAQSLPSKANSIGAAQFPLTPQKSDATKVNLPISHMKTHPVIHRGKGVGHVGGEMGSDK